MQLDIGKGYHITKYLIQAMPYGMLCIVCSPCMIKATTCLSVYFTSDYFEKCQDYDVHRAAPHSPPHPSPSTSQWILYLCSNDLLLKLSLQFLQGDWASDNDPAKGSLFT